MKPQRFEIGQAVALRRIPKGVTNVETKEYYKCPLSPGEVYHIADYEKGRGEGKGHWYVFIKEYSPAVSFQEDGFEPVDLTTEQIEALVEESISQPKTETV